MVGFLKLFLHFKDSLVIEKYLHVAIQMYITIHIN